MTSILQHQRVCDAYKEIYEQDMNEHSVPNVENGGRVRRFRMDDLITVFEAMTEANKRMTANRRQILIGLNSGYEVGDVLTDTTVKTLRGLERHLQRSAARIVKVARAGR